jgi:hypothetical protein
MADFTSYAATISDMALFTVILEFDGGTYISQFLASSPKNAAMKHSAHLVEIKGMSTLAIRRRLADRLSSEVPIAIAGIRRVWCLFSLSRKETGIAEHRGDCLRRKFEG